MRAGAPTLHLRARSVRLWERTSKCERARRVKARAPTFRRVSAGARRPSFPANDRKAMVWRSHRLQQRSKLEAWIQSFITISSCSSVQRDKNLVLTRRANGTVDPQNATGKADKCSNCLVWAQNHRLVNGPPWEFERLLEHIQNTRMTFPRYFCEFSIELQGRLVGGRA